MSNPTSILSDDSGKLTLLRQINSVLPRMATQLDYGLARRYFS